MKTAEQELRELRERMKAFEAGLREDDYLEVFVADGEKWMASDRPLADSFLRELGPEPEILSVLECPKNPRKPGEQTMFPRTHSVPGRDGVCNYCGRKPAF